MAKRERIMALLLIVAALTIGQAALAQDTEEPLVTALFFETDIRDALSEISLLTGINIIPDSTVRGPVTLDLVDVPLERALRMLLIGGGFTYRKIDDFYFVGLPDPRSTTFSELVDTELIQLNYATAERVRAALPDFLLSYVKAGGDGNLLSVTAPPAEMARILQLVSQLDQPQKQVRVSVLVTEVSDEAMLELGNTLLQFDVEKGQAVNSNWEAALEYGQGVLSLGTNIYGSLLTRLRLLQENQEATIHADPRVMVASGEPASVFMGDQLILQVPSSNDSTRTERVEVGMTLDVTATVLNGDEVLLDLSPEFSYFRKESQPDLLVRHNSVSTTVRVQDGQTLVLAGMTVSDDGSYTSKVPILGDIPLLGWLFKRDVRQQSERELLIFVTPEIQ